MNDIQAQISGNVHPQQKTVNKLFGFVGIVLAFVLGTFTFISALLLIASVFELSSGFGFLVLAGIVLGYTIVYWVHRLNKNHPIIITVDDKKRSLDNLYPVYVLLIIFVVIQALIGWQIQQVKIMNRALSS